MKLVSAFAILASLGSTSAWSWSRSSSSRSSSSSSNSRSSSSSSSSSSRTSSSSSSSSSRWTGRSSTSTTTSTTGDRTWGSKSRTSSSSRTDDHLLECSGYVANVYGDPHISTFDGLESTCQAGGEFVMAKNDDVKIHAKFEKLTTRAVSVTTAVAFDIPGIDTVQVGFSEYNSGKQIDINSVCPMHLYVDETLTSLSADIAGTGYKISKTSKSINVQFYDGSEPTYALTVQANNAGWGSSAFCYLTAYFCLPSDTDESIGLLGTPDGDSSNEWMTWDGTSLPFSTNSQEAYDYATSNHCIASESDSMMVYEDNHGGKSFDDLNECDVEFPGEVDISEADDTIVDICGEDNFDCILDGLIAGEEAAERTKDTQEKTTAIKVSDTTVDVEPDTHCAGDITLLSTDGSTPFDELPFTIVSQDTDSVTLKLRALWFDGVDVQYTQYSEDFVEKCISETDVTTASFEEITASCPGTEHVTLITVVGSDDLLDAALDTASAPECCHSAGDDAPKVKYTFMVSCVSQCPTDSRRLRGAN